MARSLSLLLSFALCSACSGPGPKDTGLSIDFSCEADRAATETIALRVIRGGCDGDDVAYEAVLERGQAAEEQVLSPGLYGVEVSAQGAAGTFARVCVEERLPNEALKLVVPATHCAAGDSGAQGDASTLPPDQKCALGEPDDCSCWEKTYEGHSYWFCEDPLQWLSARTLCRMYQRDLVIIDDAEENAFLLANTDGASRWIGATDRGDDGLPPLSPSCSNLCTKSGDEGTWRWVDPINNKLDGLTFCEASKGSSLCTALEGRYMNWDSDEPSNGGNACTPYVRCDVGEDCAVLVGNSGAWQDASCTSKLRFICESY